MLSFNLNARQLHSLYVYFGRRFAVRVLPERTEGSLVPASAREILSYVGRRLAFGDALVACAVELWVDEATAFISWDAPHFRGKVGVRVVTPAEFLEES